MITQDNKPFKMNLTLFGEGDPVIPGYGSLDGDITALLAGEGNQVPIEPPVNHDVPPVAEPTVPVAAPIEPVAPAAPVEPVPAAPVNPIDNPIVQQLIQQNQMLQQSMQQQSDIMQKFINNTMTNNAPQPAPVVMKTPEEMEAEKEAFMAKFYENPMGVLSEHTDKAVKAATEPLNQELAGFKNERAWNEAIGSIASDSQKFPEFENVRGRMGEIIKEKPYLLQSGDKTKALADAYAIAMSEKGFAQPVQPAAPIQANPADMMKNPDFIKQLIGNPEVMKMIAMEQAKLIQSNNQQVPPMSPSSGVANVAPYITNKPQNYDEADALASNFMKQGMA